MQTWNQFWVVFTATVTIAACVGCGGGDTSDESSDDSAAVESSEQPAAGGEQTPAVVPEPLPPPTIPAVVMTEGDRQKCLIYVDDSVPVGELKDAEGETVSLGDLYGEKLTVLFFWTIGEGMFAEEAALDRLRDLQKEVADVYGDQGVRVIGINENDATEAASKLIADGEITFPTLEDPDGAFFQTVATEGLPRIYAIDADSKVLWLDTEFSRITRDNLKQTIDVFLGE